jgi:hypothetical protein
MLLLLALSCKKVEPAPENIDGLSHYFWQHYDNDDDELITEAVQNAFLAINPHEMTEPMKGTVSNLGTEELSLVGKGDEDPDAISGIYFANIINCPVDIVEKGVYATNQDERHEGDYDEYRREYTSDLEAYESRAVSRLTWTTNYAVEYIGQRLAVEINGAIRHLPEIDEDLTPYGPMILSRGVLSDRSYFEGSDSRGMFQDYQLEVYFPISENRTVHYFTIWRDIVYTSTTDFSSEGIQNFVLDGMIDWDTDAESACQ